MTSEKVNIEVQTELHPIPSNIVEGYSWNEWEHRRRAVVLAKVYKCRTHSTQTHVQLVKPNVSTQTYPLKNRQMQTMRSTCAEVPRNQFYFYGLQGNHCNSTIGNKIQPHIVELTREDTWNMKVKHPKITQNPRGSISVPKLESKGQGSI